MSTADRTHTHCDSFFFYKAALDRTTDITPAGLRAAVDRLGTSYVSTQTYRTHLAPKRHGAPAFTQTSIWDAACACFKHNGQTRTIL